VATPNRACHKRTMSPADTTVVVQLRGDLKGALVLLARLCCLAQPHTRVPQQPRRVRLRVSVSLLLCLTDRLCVPIRTPSATVYLQPHRWILCFGPLHVCVDRYTAVHVLGQDTVTRLCHCRYTLNPEHAAQGETATT
jgi:hypothetical protein